jgi:hypothetical protein
VPFDGVRHVFKSLVEQRGRIALATDCKGPELKNYLSLLGVNEFMSATACGDDVEHGKPDPRLVGMALRKLDLPGSQTVMIGDTPYDAEAATEAGTAVAGVLTGEFASEVLLGAGCFAVANDLRALLPSLEIGKQIAFRTPKSPRVQCLTRGIRKFCAPRRAWDRLSSLLIWLARIAWLDQMQRDYRHAILHPRVVMSKREARMLFANGKCRGFRTVLKCSWLMQRTLVARQARH